MGVVNAEWHKQHVLGSGADMDTRVEWHIEHANACACRGIPAPVLAEIERRGMSDRLPGGAAGS